MWATIQRVLGRPVSSMWDRCPSHLLSAKSTCSNSNLLRLMHAVGVHCVLLGVVWGPGVVWWELRQRAYKPCGLVPATCSMPSLMGRGHSSACVHNECGVWHMCNITHFSTRSSMEERTLSWSTLGSRSKIPPCREFSQVVCREWQEGVET